MGDHLLVGGSGPFGVSNRRLRMSPLFNSALQEGGVERGSDETKNCKDGCWSVIGGGTCLLAVQVLISL